MSTQTPNNFSELLSIDEKGFYTMRLGRTNYVERGKDIYVADHRTGALTKVELEVHVEKPWIRRSFDNEHSFQRRKHVAEVLQRTSIPLRDRRAYKKRMGWVGA